MERARRLAHRVAVPALVALAVLAPLAVHWLSGRTVASFDTQRLYAPQRWIVDEALRAFRLPLWNPFMGAGMPFLADAIHGVLHPVSVLTAWLGTDRSADVLIGGYVACAGLGAALLARELGGSRAGAALAGVAFGSSGYVLSMSGNLVFLAGAGSLPLCVAGLRRFGVDPRPGSLALGAAGAAVLALSGDAQGLMVGGALALALAWEGGGWRGALRATAAGIVGLLLAGVQLVPSAFHLSRTVRAEETWVRLPEVWAFEPWRIAELVLPGLLRGAHPYWDPVYEGLAGAGSWPIGTAAAPFSMSVFVGLVPLTLAVAGLREGRRGRVLGGLALALLWIALGPALGADAVLGHLPLWRAFEFSEKLVGPLTLVLAVLAGLGLDAVVARRATARWLLAAAAALALASVALSHLLAGRLAADAAVEAGVRVLRGTWHVLGAAGALGGWLLLRDRLPPAAAKAGLVVLAWAGLAAASPFALRAGDPGARLSAAGPALAAAPPGPRIVTPYQQEPLSAAAELDWLDLSGRTHAALGYPAYNVRSRLDSLSPYVAMAPRRLSRLGAIFGTQWPLAARRYGVTHVVLDPPQTERQLPLYILATSGATRVREAPGPFEVWAVPHRDWASFPAEIVAVPDDEAASFALARTFMERSQRVVVESASPLEAGPGRVLSIERGLESVRIEAESAAGATLVIADAWWPGWEATLDGVAAPIAPADVLLRAVRWPAGRHRLELRYRPPEVRLGLLASALGGAALAAWLALLRRARRSVRPQ